MALQYNPVENRFMEYQAIKTPKVEINMPLLDEPFDISDWASSIKGDGTIIAKPNIPTVTIHNEEEVPITSQSEEYTQSTNIKGDKKKAMDFFVAKGLKSHVAAGIVGNLIHESGLNTSAKGDKGTALGIAQWRLDRRTGLENFAKSRGKDIFDLLTQLEWTWQELNSGYKSVLDAMNNTSNVGQATKIFMDRYEKPNIKFANFSSRLKHAESLLNG